jgi:hypothetical protein
MRLSQWRKAAPTEGAMNDRVLAVVGPVLSDLGAERDPECWVAWGEDPDLRYSLLAPTLAGLITVAIRFTNPEDGPRVIAKLVRWSKVSVSELGLDAAGGHRMVAVQVENLVLKGVDEEADRICKFVRILIAGVDDRLQVPVPITAVRSVAPMVAAAAASPAGGIDVRAERGAEGGPAPKTRRVTKLTALMPPAPGVAVVGSSPAAPPQGAPPQAALSPEQAGPLTSIAASPAARHATADEEPEVPTRPQNGEPESEPDRSSWVSPHHIEEQLARKPSKSNKPSKPRTWIP